MTSTYWGKPEVKKYSKIDSIELSILHPLFHQLLDEVNGKKIVDYGCGEGRLLEELAEK
jgi:2-polyprenyl-3-methyl-5-hydroxy-6-metoxy-1,4-benzoquinol methylase